MAFPKKSCLGQMGHLRPKMARPHNSGSAVRIVLQCCTMKGAKRDMEIILMVFLKKIDLGQFGHFGPKMCVLITLGLLQVFFKNFAQ